MTTILGILFLVVYFFLVAVGIVRDPGPIGWTTMGIFVFLGILFGGGKSK